MTNFLTPIPYLSKKKRGTSQKRTVSIFGSTGSIGTSALDVIDTHRDLFQVETLTAQNNVDLLIRQCHQFKPRFAVIGNEALFDRLCEGVAGTDISAGAGKKGVLEAGERPADIFLAAIVGAAGLPPTLKSLEHGTRVALANKECLVCAGNLFMQKAKQYGTEILPVDSEHSGVYQALAGHDSSQLEKIILTASGGPFRSLSIQEMKSVTLEQALDHPNWEMGKKITIDSATMMNKGLELIEAYHLFGIRGAKLDAVIHPQSIVHAIVSYKDGSSIAQLGQPDMRAPIAYGLQAPSRLETNVKSLDLSNLCELTFSPIDEEKFPAVKIAKSCIGQQGGLSCILNGANEVAVEAYLDGKIHYLDIVAICEQTLNALTAQKLNQSSLEDVLDLDDRSRIRAAQFIEKFRNSSY